MGFRETDATHELCSPWKPKWFVQRQNNLITGNVIPHWLSLAPTGARYIMMRHLMEICVCKLATFYFHSAQCSTSVTAAPLNRRNIFNAIQGNLCNAWHATINATLAQLTKCMQQTSKCKKYDVMERIQPRPKTSLLASTAHLLPLTRVPSFRLTQVTASLCPINLGNCFTCVGPIPLKH